MDPAVIDELSVHPGRPAGLARRSTTDTRTPWLDAIGHATPKEVAEEDLDASKAELARAQEQLYAAGRWAVLIIFQGLDAGGKDGTIRHVMSGVNPQGCEVHSFKQPSELELSHDYLWRCAVALPSRGRIGIFNRSHYEDVLVVRVHPELPGAPRADVWRDRFEDINAFERHLSRNGTKIVKFFLHLSKAEQRRRLLARIDDPAKQWKFSPSDLAEHERFDDYQSAYEDAITATSTPWAPWYVVPADHKYAMRALVGGIVVHAIDELDLSLPVPTDEQRQGMAQARRTLAAEH